MYKSLKKLKCIVSIIAVLSVLLSMPIYAKADALIPAKNYVITKTSANAEIKKEADSKSKTIGKIKKGKKVMIVSFDKKWYKIKFKKNGKYYYGYIHINKLKKSDQILLDNTSLNLQSGYNYNIIAQNIKGKKVNKNMKWWSSNGDIARVNANGTVSPIGIGTAYIHAASGNTDYVCTVNVRQASPLKINTYTAKTNTAIYKQAKKKSNKLVKIPAKTKITFKSKTGKWAKVSAKINNKTYKGYMPYSHIVVTTTYKEYKTKGVTIKGVSNPTVYNIGSKISLIAQLTPANATNKIAWSSTKPDVASVSDSGVVTCNKYGKTTIRLTSGNKRASIAITVAKSGLTISNSTIPMTVGATYNIYRNVVFSKINKSNSTFTSSNPAIASVNNNIITAHKYGTTTISVKNGSYSGSFTVEVHPVSTNALAPITTLYYTDTNYPSGVYNPEYVPLEKFIENTYSQDGAYHPECLYFKDGFNGYKYWLTYTPYPWFSDGYENPCILASNDLSNWEIPAGGSNPIEPRPTDYVNGKIYNSDTDLVYNTDTKQLECWWRKYDAYANQITIFRKTTSDGVNWNNKEAMLQCVLNKEDYLSPAILYENGVYKMWAVDKTDNYSVVYREYNPKNKTWSKREIIEITYTTDNLLSWHLGVIHTSKGYEMVISAFDKATPNDHIHMDLYYCYSKDNKSYSVADIMLKPSRDTDNWDNYGIYRSTMMYADGKYYLFYPGIKKQATGNQNSPYTYYPSGIGIISGDSAYTMS